MTITNYHLFSIKGAFALHKNTSVWDDCEEIYLSLLRVISEGFIYLYHTIDHFLTTSFADKHISAVSVPENWTWLLAEIEFEQSTFCGFLWHATCTETSQTNSFLLFFFKKTKTNVTQDEKLHLLLLVYNNSWSRLRFTVLSANQAALFLF